MKSPQLLLILFSVALIFQSFKALPQEKEIQNIRKMYYQNLSFDTIRVIADRMVPGVGQQDITIDYVYYSCIYLDCDEDLFSEVPVLRKVVIDRVLNTTIVHNEFLYDKVGVLVFHYRNISSEYYYDETGRECAEERYYLKDRKPIQISIAPCIDTEIFDEILQTDDFDESSLSYLKSIEVKASVHLKSFTGMIEAE